MGMTMTVEGEKRSSRTTGISSRAFLVRHLRELIGYGYDREPQENTP